MRGTGDNEAHRAVKDYVMKIRVKGLNQQYKANAETQNHVSRQGLRGRPGLRQDTHTTRSPKMAYVRASPSPAVPARLSNRP